MSMVDKMYKIIFLFLLIISSATAEIDSNKTTVVQDINKTAEDLKQLELRKEKIRKEFQNYLKF